MINVNVALSTNVTATPSQPTVRITSTTVVGPRGVSWVQVTQAEYDALTPDDGTLYIVIG